jgi:hypothetical protein
MGRVKNGEVTFPNGLISRAQVRRASYYIDPVPSCRQYNSLAQVPELRNAAIIADQLDAGPEVVQRAVWLPGTTDVL